MNFKILDPGAELPDVLVFRDRDKDGKEIVKIHAFGSKEDVEDYILEEVIVFETSGTAQNFIGSYSKKDAKEWCQRNEISY